MANRRQRRKQRGSKAQKAAPRINLRPGVRFQTSEPETSPEPTAPGQITAEDIPHREFFWKNIVAAVGCEPRPVETIRGASGLEHRLLAAGVDEARKRLVIVSGEPDARSAALAHSDIQAASGDMQVLVARPIVVNAQGIATSLAEVTGLSRIGPTELQRLPTGGTQEETNELFEPYVEPVMRVVTDWFSNAYSLRSFDWVAGLQQLLDEVRRIDWRQPGIIGLNLLDLYGGAPAVEDVSLGTCGFPVYALSGDEMELINSGSDLEVVRQLLTKHNVLQYFFPPPDQLALGLVERQRAPEDALVRQLRQSASLGHPYAANEIVRSDVQILEMIEALADLGYVLRSKTVVEMTPEGESVRQEVRIAPREGLVSKIMNRFNADFDLNIFKIG